MQKNVAPIAAGELESGFGRAEINRIAALVEANRAALLQAWDEFFND